MALDTSWTDSHPVQIKSKTQPVYTHAAELTSARGSKWASYTPEKAEQLSDQLIARQKVLNEKFLKGTLTAQEKKESREIEETLFDLAMNLKDIYRF